MAKPKIDKEKLAELWNKGASTSDIADMMGVKVESLYKMAHRIGLPKRKGGKTPLLTDQEKRKWFIRNYPEMSNSTISVFLGLSEDYIGVVARQLGLKKSEAYWNGIREYHKKRVRQFHESKNGDKDFYAHNARPKAKDGKFIKKKDYEDIFEPSYIRKN